MKIFILHSLIIKIIISSLVINFIFQKQIYCQSKVFKGKRVYRYETWTNNDSLNIHKIDTLMMISTGKRFTLTSDTQQRELIYFYKNIKPDSIENKISEAYTTKSADFVGAVENEKLCWFHPPILFQYLKTIYAPYPIVEFPLEVNKKYKRFTFYGEGWSELKDKEFVCNYEIKEKIKINTTEYWHITATSYIKTNPHQINTFDFYFNEETGFYWLIYIFSNKTKLEMKLIENENDK